MRTKPPEKEQVYGKMGVMRSNTLVNERINSDMVEASKPGKTEANTKVSGKMTKDTGKEL